MVSNVRLQSIEIIHHVVYVLGRVGVLMIQRLTASLLVAQCFHFAFKLTEMPVIVLVQYEIGWPIVFFMTVTGESSATFENSALAVPLPKRLMGTIVSTGIVNCIFLPYGCM